MAQKAWFCGPPDEVIEGIKSIEAKYPGLEDFMIHWAEGIPPEEFKDQLRWFAKDVMPAFSGTEASVTRTPVARGRAVPVTSA